MLSKNGKESFCRGVGKLQVWASFECLFLSHFTRFSPTTGLNFLTKWTQDTLKEYKLLPWSTAQELDRYQKW